MPSMIKSCPLALLVTILYPIALPAVDYSVIRDVSAVTSEVVTLFRKATSSRNVRGKSVLVTCSVACDVVIERSGSNPTTGATVPNPVLQTAPVDVDTSSYVGADTGAGTVIGKAFTTGAGSVPIDLAAISLDRGQHFSVRITSGGAGRYVVSLLIDVLR